MEKALLPSAQAIEKSEEHHANPGGYERIQKKAKREHRHRMGEKRALGDGQYNLMKMEKNEYEPEAADGMLGINPSANRRGDVADARFCDAVHADGIVVAQGVLGNADRGAEEHAAYRIAAAHSEIDCDEQRQIDQFGEAAILVKESLQDERKETDEWNSAAIVFVNLDIRFRSGAGAQHGVHVNSAREGRLLADSSQREDSAGLVRATLLSSSALIPAA